MYERNAFSLTSSISLIGLETLNVGEQTAASQQKERWKWTDNTRRQNQTPRSASRRARDRRLAILGFDLGCLRRQLASRSLLRPAPVINSTPEGRGIEEYINSLKPSAAAQLEIARRAKTNR
jgi:hypothetical protein